MNEPLKRYLDEQRSLGRARGTVSGVARTLARFLGFCGCPVPEVTAAHLAAYRQHLEKTPHARGGLRSPNTVAAALFTLRHFLRWAVRHGWLLADPSRHLVVKRPPRPLPRLLTVAETHRLLAVPDTRTVLGRRDRALLETLYCLGLRLGECRALNLGDLDWSQRVVRIAPGKSRLARMLPLGQQLGRILTAYLEESRPELARHPSETALFLSQRGRRISKPRMEQIVTLAATQLGLIGVSCHSLRHACATHLLAGGADLAEVQIWLGHVYVQSTQTYTHLQPLEVCNEHARTHPRARRR